MTKNKSDIKPGGVDEYIAKCPPEVRDKLNQVRAAIKSVSPGSVETVSYFAMPGYMYEGYDYNGMFVWFSFKKPLIRLHLRPPVVQDHKKELADLITTTSIVSFPSDGNISTALVKKLTLASIKVMKDKSV